MGYFLTTLSPDFYYNDLSFLSFTVYCSLHYKFVTTLPSLRDISDFNERNGTFNIFILVHDLQTFVV